MMLTTAKLQVRLETFEGPLDLLLQLIRAQKIDIYDIPIAQITDQYLAYLTAVEEMDLEIASEFLVMAATLLDIKARMLFPRIGDKGQAEDDAAGDPRQELSRRLAEYERYSEAGRLFRALALAGSQYGYRSGRPEAPPARFLAPGQNAALLALALRPFKSRLADSPPAELTPERPTILSQIKSWLRELRRRGGHGRFFEVIGQGRPRRYLIAAFLALLELVHQGRLTVVQSPRGDDILIAPGPGWRVRLRHKQGSVGQ